MRRENGQSVSSCIGRNIDIAIRPEYGGRALSRIYPYRIAIDIMEILCVDTDSWGVVNASRGIGDPGRAGIFR